MPRCAVRHVAVFSPHDRRASETAQIAYVDKFAYNVRNSLYFVDQYGVQSISAGSQTAELTFESIDAIHERPNLAVWAVRPVLSDR